jgi:hypothetical protein
VPLAKWDPATVASELKTTFLLSFGWVAVVATAVKKVVAIIVRQKFVHSFIRILLRLVVFALGLNGD